MMWARLLPLGAGAIGIIAAVIWLVSLVRENDRLEAVEERFKACAVAAGKAGAAEAVCPQALSDAVTRARRYLDCDAALVRGDLYVVRAACSAAVKRRDAAATAAAATAASLAAELTRERAAGAAALNRAAARADAIQRKDRNAQAAIAAAPRGADGRLRCDDDCLRRLVD